MATHSSIFAWRVPGTEEPGASQSQTRLKQLSTHTCTCKRMKLEHFLTSYTKINSKWIKDLNVRPETINLLEENTGRTLDDVNQNKILYDPPPRIMEIKTKVNKWDLIKCKSFCTAKETVSKVKDNP